MNRDMKTEHASEREEPEHARKEERREAESKKEAAAGTLSNFVPPMKNRLQAHVPVLVLVLGLVLVLVG